jgi:hypothetical protein
MPPFDLLDALLGLCPSVILSALHQKEPKCSLFQEFALSLPASWIFRVPRQTMAAIFRPSLRWASLRSPLSRFIRSPARPTLGLESQST